MTDADREYEDNIFTQRVNLWQTDDDAKALMFDEHLGRLIADLAGVDRLGQRKRSAECAVAPLDVMKLFLFHLAGELLFTLEGEHEVVDVDVDVDRSCLVRTATGDRLASRLVVDATGSRPVLLESPGPRRGRTSWRRSITRKKQRRILRARWRMSMPAKLRIERRSPEFR